MKRGVTLLEVLGVLLILGVLAGLLFPVVGMVRERVALAQVRLQLARYTEACASYRAAYGQWPDFGQEGDTFRLQGQNAVFAETLTGRGLDGGEAQMAGALAANPRRTPFLQLGEEDFGDPARPDILADAFGNANLVLVFDTDGDGRIPAASVPGEVDVRAGVAAYTENPGGRPDWPVVTTW